MADTVPASPSPSPPAPALVVGADGNLGAALLAALRRAGVPALGTTRRAADASPGLLRVHLGEPTEAWRLPPTVSVAYLCAGVTSTALCRQHPEPSRRINVERTLDLARLLQQRGAAVVFLSSNQVFDGTRRKVAADFPANPASVYGEQKAAVEAALLGETPDAFVLRLTKVVHPGFALFERWGKALSQGEAIRPFSDVRLAPVPRDVVVDALVRLADAATRGRLLEAGVRVLQLSGDEDVLYGAVAQRLVQRLGADPKLVHAQSSAAAGVEVEQRGPHTTLDAGLAERLLGVACPPTWQAIDAALPGGFALPGEPRP